MSKSYYQIGEFAKICGVAKSTLMYYAKLGLFPPDHIGENGYFYYAPGQIFAFESIITLREMEVPLVEIKKYLTTVNPQYCMEVLEKNLKVVTKRRLQLEKLESLIHNTLKETRAVSNEAFEKKELIRFEKPETYFVYKMPYRTEKCTFDLTEARKLINYCKDNFYNASLRVAGFVLPHDVINGTFHKTYGAFKLYENSYYVKENENVFVRPSGLYATVAKYSTGDEIPEIYQELVRYARDNNYQANGIAFETDLLSHVMNHNGSNYPVRCYLQVSQRK